jgi:hypothetical protein
MNKDQEIAGWKRNAGIMTFVATGLKDFSANILIAAKGSPLSEDAITEIKRTCIIDLKNYSFEGLPLEQETAFFWEAIKIFETFADMAIDQARKGQ